MIPSNDAHSFFYPGSPDKGVLLIHGLTGSPAEMKYLGKQLHKRGFTVYTPTLSGHCRDVDALLQTTWQDWYASVDAAYRQFREHVREVYAAGVCAGGTLALNLAAEHPELAGVTVYSLAFRYDGWNMPKLHKLTDALSLVAGFPLIRRIRFAEKYPFGLKDERLRSRVQNGEVLVEGALDYFPMGALNQMYRLSEHVRHLLPQIKAPTLLLHAREDDMSDVRNAEYVAKNIGGPYQLHLLEDSYHMIHVDQERRKVAELTAEFFGNPNSKIQAVL
jgi:carboxylesterase